MKSKCAEPGCHRKARRNETEANCLSSPLRPFPRSIPVTLWKPRRLPLLLLALVSVGSLPPQTLARVSPMDFGAAGDGLADDSEALLEAIGSGEASINLDGYIYRISGGLDVESPVTLRGPGVLRLGDDSGDASHLRILSDDVALINMMIQVDANEGLGGYAIRVHQVENFQMNNVQVSSSTEVLPLRVTETTSLSIRHCAFTGSSSDGVAGAIIDINASRRLQLFGNRLAWDAPPSPPAEASEPAGLRIRNSSQVVLSGNRVHAPGDGISTQLTTHVTSTGNHSHGGASGFAASSTQYATHIGNRSMGSGAGFRLGQPGAGEAPQHPARAPQIHVPENSLQGISLVSRPGGNSVDFLTDGRFDTSTTFARTLAGLGPSEFSFDVHLSGRETVTDFVFVSDALYRGAGQTPAGRIRIATRADEGLPYSSALYEDFSCERPPSDELIEERRDLGPLMTEARRVVLGNPKEADALRFTAHYCLDRFVLLSQVMVNGGPFLHRLRPLSPDLLVDQSRPVNMMDGDPASPFRYSATAGTLVIDVAPYPVVIDSITLSGTEGDCGDALPAIDSLRIADFDGGLASAGNISDYSVEQEGCDLRIAFNPPLRGRFLQLGWSSLANPSLTTMAVAEISVDHDGGILPGTSGPRSRALVLKGNHAVSSQSGSARKTVESATAGSPQFRIGRAAGYSLLSGNLAIAGTAGSHEHQDGGLLNLSDEPVLIRRFLHLAPPQAPAPTIRTQWSTY